MKKLYTVIIVTLISLPCFSIDRADIEKIEIHIDSINVKNKFDTLGASDIRVVSYLASDTGSMYSSLHDRPRSDSQTNQKILGLDLSFSTPKELILTDAIGTLTRDDLGNFISNSEISTWSLGESYLSKMIPGYLTVSAFEDDILDDDFISVEAFKLSNLVEGDIDGENKIIDHSLKGNLLTYSFILVDNGSKSDQLGTGSSVRGRVLIEYTSSANLDEIRNNLR